MMSMTLPALDRDLGLTPLSDLLLRHRLKIVEDLWRLVLEQECGQELVVLLEQLRGLQLPDGQAADVLAMYRAIAPRFADRNLPVRELSLTGRGSWLAQLDTNAPIELGRGNVPEVVERVDRLLKTLTQVTSRYGRSMQMLESADLRHENGYALKLRGVTTIEPGSVTKTSQPQSR